MFYKLFTHENEILWDKITKFIIQFSLETEGKDSSGKFIPNRSSINAPRSTNYIEKDNPSTCDVFIKIV